MDRAGFPLVARLKEARPACATGSKRTCTMRGLQQDGRTLDVQDRRPAATSVTPAIL